MSQPTMQCPRCKREYEDFDGLPVIYCEACGYCRHASRTDGICDYCGLEDALGYHDGPHGEPAAGTGVNLDIIKDRLDHIIMRCDQYGYDNIVRGLAIEAIQHITSRSTEGDGNA